MQGPPQAEHLTDDGGGVLEVTWTARGPNHAFGIADGGRAVCRVWQRPDLSAEEGAKCAEAMLRHVVTVAQSGVISTILFDLRDAPPVAGPRTQLAMRQMFGLLEEGQKRLAVVTTPGVQQLQIARLVDADAPKFGLTTDSLAVAIEFTQGRRPTLPG